MENAGCALVSGAHLPNLVTPDETEYFRLQRQPDGNFNHLEVLKRGAGMRPRNSSLAARRTGVCHHLADPNLRAVICKVTRTGTSPDRDTISKPASSILDCLFARIVLLTR
jgi:hypothetical protein